ncbi:MAG: hypothetical protein ACOC9Y_04470 [Chloroflexota bacterium]
MLETRTLPASLVRQRADDTSIAEGWCIIAFETGVKYEALEEWRGEMIVDDSDARRTIEETSGQVLYLQCRPYGGEFESWHGPVLVELVDSEHDPYQRRARLRAAGPLIRSDRVIPGLEAESTADVEEG